ncbi:MAG: hypothetical protein ACXADW_18435, partial [Candidatus Hodarchaeales archaeon]
MAAPNCKNPNEFVNRIASVKSHLMENGVIDKYYNITDYNKYREFVVKDRQLLRDKYSIEAAPYYANKTPRGWTLQINDELMYRLDAINGKFYAENSHLRNNIDPLLSSSHTYLKATAQSLERFKDDPKSKKLSELFDQLSVKFQNAFNIASYKIDSSRATEILKNTNTPYKGQAAFAYGGNIYFVEDVANITSVLHEYAHPLIKVIAKDNSKLFNKLYKDVVNTATGVYIRKRVLEKYPELEVESDRFKEEVLVTALETKATNVLGNEIDKKGLDSVIKRILYAIKQILRKLTSAKNFKTFDENTTLDQLANMMVSEDFVIDTSRIDMESIVDFQKQFSDLYNKLQNVESSALVQAVNRAYVEGKFQLKTLRDKPYKFKEKLNEMGGLKALRNMRDYVKDYQTIEKSESEVEDILKMLDEQQDDFRVRSVALVNSINQAKELGMDIAEILYDLEKNNRHKTAEGITRITFFKEFLIGQKQFIRELEKILKLPPGNEFLEELLTVRNIAENSLDKIKDLQMEFVLDLMQENTSFMQENLEKKITRDIERLLSKSNVSDEKVKSIVEQVIGTENPQGFKVSNVTINGEALKLDSYVTKELENKITRYFAKRFTQDSIRKYVSGETEDLGFISSMALPYMSMDDPIGSFVAYTKKEMNKAQAKSLDKANEISNKLVPLLEAVGYSKLDTQQLMRMVGFEDTIGVYNNETGEVDQIKIYTYLNKFKDYRYDKEVLERNVEKAFESGNKDKIINARRELREFEENYMHRKYKKEYYDAGKMWSEDNVVTHPITKETFTVS